MGSCWRESPACSSGSSSPESRPSRVCEHFLQGDFSEVSMISLSSAMLGVLSLMLVALPLTAQTPRDLTIERTGYLAWLKQAPNSPLAAVARQAVGEGVR